MIDSRRGRPAVHELSRSDLPFRLLALARVITGGLVAAVTSPLGLGHGSWSAAFQVLVDGVLQAGLGAVDISRRAARDAGQHLDRSGPRAPARPLNLRAH